MEGITHPAFREILSSAGGIGVVCTEFVRVTGAAPRPSLFRRQLVAASQSALSVQVMGNHVEHLAEASRLATEAGADLVDLNVGCPAPRVVKKGVGAAMLKDPELLSRVVEAMRRATPGFLTAKMRAGFDSADSAVQTAERLEAAGVDLITVHPRRRSDFYRGVADWQVVGAIRRAVSVPVVGNGDVWFAADAFRMRRQTGCAGVMIGRGALRNPWIFQQIAALSEDRAPLHPGGDDLLAHVDRLAQALVAQGQRVLGPLKEHLRYLLLHGSLLPPTAGWAEPPGSGTQRSPGLDEAPATGLDAGSLGARSDFKELRRRALRASSLSELRDLLAESLAGLPPQALALGAWPRAGSQLGAGIEAVERTVEAH